MTYLNKIISELNANKVARIISENKNLYTETCKKISRIYGGCPRGDKPNKKAKCVNCIKYWLYSEIKERK